MSSLAVIWSSKSRTSAGASVPSSASQYRLRRLSSTDLFLRVIRSSTTNTAKLFMASIRRDPHQVKQSLCAGCLAFQTSRRSSSENIVMTVLVGALKASVTFLYLLNTRSCACLCIEATQNCRWSILQICSAELPSIEGMSFPIMTWKRLRRGLMLVITWRGERDKPSTFFPSRSFGASLRTDGMRGIEREQSVGASLDSANRARNAAIISRFSHSIVPFIYGKYVTARFRRILNFDSMWRRTLLIKCGP